MHPEAEVKDPKTNRRIYADPLEIERKKAVRLYPVSAMWTK